MRTALCCLWIGVFAVYARAQVFELPLPTFAQARAAAAYKFPKGDPNHGRRTPIILMGISMITAIMDVEGTQHCMTIGTCHEGNPLMPSSRLGAYAVKGALVGITTLSSFAWHRSNLSRDHHIRRRFWWLPETEMIGINLAGFASSLPYWHPKGQ